MNVQGKLLALGLTAALLLPTSVLAADTQGRQADLDALCQTLEAGHPNLYANVTQADFLSRKTEIQAGLGEGDDFTFAMELQSLVALVGDSHTTLSFSAAGEDLHYLPAVPDRMDGRWVLGQVAKEHQALLGRELTAVNGLTMDEVTARFRALASADNEVRLNRQTEQMFYVAEILSYLGIAKTGEPVALTLKDGTGKLETIRVESHSAEELKTAEMVSLKSTRAAAPATEYDKGRYYFSLPLNESTYYIQYNRCQQDSENPMEDFALQVAKDLEGGAYTKVLLDLRNNGGGSDGVVGPLLEVLMPGVRDGSVKLFGLIGETTFSSAVINASMVQEMGGFLAGAPTGGSVDHFGAVNSFALPTSGLKGGHSTKFIDMETILISAAGLGVESLAPDFPAEQGLSDYLAGRDTLVERLLKEGDAFTIQAKPQVLATRAGFVENLWRSAGSPVALGENTFEDLFPIASYVPALDWAQEQGLALGDGAGCFRPADQLTQAERDLLQARFEGLSQT